MLKPSNPPEAWVGDVSTTSLPADLTTKDFLFSKDSKAFPQAQCWLPAENWPGQDRGREAEDAVSPRQPCLLRPPPLQDEASPAEPVKGTSCVTVTRTQHYAE